MPISDPALFLAQIPRLVPYRPQNKNRPTNPAWLSSTATRSGPPLPRNIPCRVGSAGASLGVQLTECRSDFSTGSAPIWRRGRAKIGPESISEGRVSMRGSTSPLATQSIRRGIGHSPNRPHQFLRVTSRRSNQQSTPPSRGWICLGMPSRKMGQPTSARRDQLVETDERARPTKPHSEASRSPGQPGEE